MTDTDAARTPDAATDSDAVRTADPESAGPSGTDPTEPARPTGPAGGSTDRDGYVHLFGDVYWAWKADTYVLALLGLVTLFVDYATLVDTFGGFFDWLQQTAPGTAERLESNYDRLWMACFLLALAFGFRFDPDFSA